MSHPQQEVTLRAQRPTMRRKATYALLDSSGKWNFANASGTLNPKGVLHFVFGKRSAAMKSVTSAGPTKGKATSRRSSPDTRSRPVSRSAASR